MLNPESHIHILLGCLAISLSVFVFSVHKKMGVRGQGPAEKATEVFPWMPGTGIIPCGTGFFCERLKLPLPAGPFCAIMVPWARCLAYHMCTQAIKGGGHMKKEKEDVDARDRKWTDAALILGALGLLITVVFVIPVMIFL